MWFRLIRIIIILWAIGFFVIKPLGITGTLTASAAVTAIICGTILLAIITIVYDKPKK
jgi:hypothetical protein